MESTTLNSWIRREAFVKGFSKDDLFIGEIRLHNVLCNQIPSLMLNQGYNQQSVRKELLRMIDHDGFSEELEAESKRRRKRAHRLRGITPAAAAESPLITETNPVLEGWIRKEASRVAFSKEGLFIGEIRLHNVLINSISSTLVSQGYTPQSVRRSLLKMIEEGFSKDLQKESRRRRGIGQSPPGSPTVSVSDWDVASQAGVAASSWEPEPQPSGWGWNAGGPASGSASLGKNVEFPPLGKQSSSSSSDIKPQPTISSPPAKSPTPAPHFPPMQWGPRTTERRTFGDLTFEDFLKENETKKPTDPLGETVGSKRLKALKFPFCVQHTILTFIQNTLEAACFDYAQINCPAILSRKGWGCHHAGELSSWTKELRASYDTGELSGGVMNSNVDFIVLLKDLDDLTNTAVHRIPISQERLIELAGTALDTMMLLEDEGRELKVREIVGVISGCTQECIGSLDTVNAELERELQQLDIEKKKLEARELKIRQKAENAMKEVEGQVERKFVEGLKTLNIHSHYVGSA